MSEKLPQHIRLGKVSAWFPRAKGFIPNVFTALNLLFMPPHAAQQLDLSEQTQTHSLYSCDPGTLNRIVDRDGEPRGFLEDALIDGIPVQFGVVPSGGSVNVESEHGGLRSVTFEQLQPTQVPDPTNITTRQVKNPNTWLEWTYSGQVPKLAASFLADKGECVDIQNTNPFPILVRTTDGIYPKQTNDPLSPEPCHDTFEFNLVASGGIVWRTIEEMVNAGSNHDLKTVGGPIMIREYVEPNDSKVQPTVDDKSDMPRAAQNVHITTIRIPGAPRVDLFRKSAFGNAPVWTPTIAFNVQPTCVQISQREEAVAQIRVGTPERPVSRPPYPRRHYVFVPLVGRR